MAENVFVVDIIPDSDNVDLDAILEEVKRRLPPYARLVDYKKEPYVFGVYKLTIRIVVPEREGLADEIESMLGSIEGVSAEIVRMGRL